LIPSLGSFNQLVIHLTSPLDNADDALAGIFFQFLFLPLQISKKQKKTKKVRTSLELL